MTSFDQHNQQVQTQYNAGRDINVYQPPLSLTEAQRKRNRSRMLERVQAIWIDGVLEPSVQGAAQIALALENKPNAVVTPLWHVLREYDTTGRLSSADVSIVQVYNQANGEVLILGEPGAGKSTLLLELTRDLLERARRDETYPIPVVFNLSSWAQTQQPLAEWLASELATTYQVPRALATSWIETDQVLPLLDGLDEVAASHRDACVEAINTYRRAHGLLPTVVCCRQIDYLMLSTRLLLRTAVFVQPLTSQQVESYLANGGERLEALHQALQEDADLQTLATTPLMLKVLAVVYQGMPSEEIVATGSPGSKREQIFATYIQRMLARRSISTRYTPTQTIHWLSWLAWQMKRHNQAEFYLERMQPDWLEEHQPLRHAYRAAVRMGTGLLGGLVFGLLGGLVFGPISGLSIGLSNGGAASIQHAVLRTFLWRAGYTPWNYSRFLDHAAERILLRKVGGGYIFLHRLLLDYFAARETTPVLDEATERRQASTPAPVSPSNVPSEPTVLAVLPDLSAPTISLAPPASLFEAPRSLPCGHELRTPGARFCTVCGAPITMPHTPT